MRDVIFICFDSLYCHYARVLIKSALFLNPKLEIECLGINLRPRQIRRLALTKRLYLHEYNQEFSSKEELRCFASQKRFCIYRQWIKEQQETSRIIACDVDGIVKKPLDELFDFIGKHKIVIQYNPATKASWRVDAALFGFISTRSGFLKSYAKKLSHIPTRWYADQKALSSVIESNKWRWTPRPEWVCSTNPDADVCFYFYRGRSSKKKRTGFRNARNIWNHIRGNNYFIDC